MNSPWQQLTLAHLQPYRWRGGSYIYRLVGLLSHWRQGSWLLQWAEPLGALLISLVLVASPFVATSWSGVLLMACGGYWALLTLSDDTKPGMTPIHLLVLLYWGIATTATALSPVRQAAFSGLVKLTLYLLFFALCATILRRPKLRAATITVYLLVALVVSIYGIRQQLFGAQQLATWNDPNSVLAQDTRVYSYLGNPNLLAGYLLAAIAFSLAAVFVWRGWLQKSLALIMLVINSACLYFTDSRGGWLAMLVLLAVFSLLLYYCWQKYLSPFWRTWLLPIIFGACSIFLLVAIVAVEPLRLRVMSIFAGREDSSNNFRLNVWDAVKEMIRDRPWLGIGPGNDAFNKIYPLYMRPNYTALSAYSIYLETAVETGYLGLAAFCWLLLTTFNQAFLHLARLRPTNSNQSFWLIAACAAMAGMLAQGTFDTVWYRPQISILWWLLVGLVASYYEPKTKSDEPLSQ